jgi:hypothetical protein
MSELRIVEGNLIEMAKDGEFDVIVNAYTQDEPGAAGSAAAIKNK